MDAGKETGAMLPTPGTKLTGLPGATISRRLRKGSRCRQFDAV